MQATNPQRSLPSRKLIKRELEAGKLGEPGLIRVHYWEQGGGAQNESAELPQALLEQIDLILWLMTKPARSVYAVEGRTQTAQGRYLQIHLAFPGDAMALLVYSSQLPAAVPYRSLHVIGSAGAAYADDQQNMQLLLQQGEARVLVAEEKPREEAGLVQMPQDWKPALAVAEAVKRSLASRQAVTLEGR